MEKSTNNKQTTQKPPRRRKYFEFKEWWDSLPEQFKGQDL